MIRVKSREELLAWLDGIDSPSDRHLQAVGGDPLHYQLDDLYTLYQFARMTACVSILEIGAGWSTAVLALALEENEDPGGYTARHPAPWTLHTIDASKEWGKLAVKRVPKHLRDRVALTVSEVEPYEHAGQSCHRFVDWPACAPDLIYLDGPDPDQAPGVRGQADDGHGLPMSADLLAVEHHLWPGTTVIVDGRTANARFLAANFRRRWQTWEDPFGDRTWMRLDEPPLGPVSVEHLEQRKQMAKVMREGGHARQWGQVG